MAPLAPTSEGPERFYMTKPSIPKAKNPQSRKASASPPPNARASRRAAKGGAEERQHPALDNALRYAKEFGFPVIWMPRGMKNPVENKWPERGSKDPKVIRQWAKEHPLCNFALLTGHGVIAIDVDDTKVVGELEAQGLEIPNTLAHRTPKGAHFFLSVPPDLIISGKVKKVHAQVDIRAWHNQVPCPGSVRKDGQYVLMRDVPIAPLPDAWLQRLIEIGAVKDKSGAVLPSNGKRRRRRVSSAAMIPEHQRNNTLISVGGSMRRAGKSEEEIRARLQEMNETRMEKPLPDREVESVARSAAKYPIAPDVQEILNSERPWVQLPGDNWEMATTAAELGDHLAHRLFLHNNDVVEIKDGALRVVSADAFRTLVQYEVACVRIKNRSNGASVDVVTTMSDADARGILASPQFREKLRSIRFVSTYQGPVFRAKGKLDLLPEGYDVATQTMTMSTVAYQKDMPIKKALAALDRFFEEFLFTDGERSKAVAIAMLLGLYAKQLVPNGAPRPIFIATKNAPGAGATTIARCAVVTVLGDMPVATFTQDETELRKLVTAMVRAGITVLVFDNVRGQIRSSIIESLATASVWLDRTLGGSELTQGRNELIVIFTLNQATINSDSRRRALFIDLHLADERPEERKFQRALDDEAIKAMRPEILAACWALVRNWDEKGRPLPSHHNSSFPAWGNIIGGIVEAAGYACPLEVAQVSIVADEDHGDMVALSDAMTPLKKYNFATITDLCRRKNFFPSLVSSSYESIDKSQRAILGRLFETWRDRAVGKSIFRIGGTRHIKTFWVERVAPVAIPHEDGRMVRDGLQAGLRRNRATREGLRTTPNHPTIPTRPSGRPRKYAREGHETSMDKGDSITRPKTKTLKKMS
jgi:hypothetical protein